MKKIRKFIVSLMLAIFCGACCGKLVYSMYDKRIDSDIGGEKLYLVQSGAYSSYDSMVDKVSKSNYVYYEDSDGLYKSIIGITSDSVNVDKIKNNYGGDTVVREYYSKDIELNNKIRDYDLKIKEAKDNSDISSLINDMLSLYKGKNTTLVQIES